MQIFRGSDDFFIFSFPAAPLNTVHGGGGGGDGVLNRKNPPPHPDLYLNSFVLGVDLGEGGGWRSCFLSDIKKTCPLGFVACGLLLFWFCVNFCKVLFKTTPTQMIFS